MEFGTFANAFQCEYVNLAQRAPTPSRLAPTVVRTQVTGGWRVTVCEVGGREQPKRDATRVRTTTVNERCRQVARRRQIGDADPDGGIAPR